MYEVNFFGAFEPMWNSLTFTLWPVFSFLPAIGPFLHLKNSEAEIILVARGRIFYSHVIYSFKIIFCHAAYYFDAAYLVISTRQHCFPKTLNAGGIRTRISCVCGECNDHFSSPPGQLCNSSNFRGRLSLALFFSKKKDNRHCKLCKNETFQRRKSLKKSPLKVPKSPLKVP
jgi:hypothetical protein